MFNFNVKDGSLPGGQFYLNVPVSMPEMYVFRSIADVRFSPLSKGLKSPGCCCWANVALVGADTSAVPAVRDPTPAGR